MKNCTKKRARATWMWAAAMAVLAAPVLGQLVDKTLTSQTEEGINKSLAQQIGAGRGDLFTPDSSIYIINRDPFRAVRRGRQIFQRKFRRAQGQGPLEGDGVGDIKTNLAIGAGLADSCAACHGRPRGSAGSGGDVVTRPDSRDAPHLFGLGLQEMLADEITADLRAIKAAAKADAIAQNKTITRNLTSKGISYGTIKGFSDGSVDTTGVKGVNTDLRVRPFFAQGGTISIREFAVGAFNAEMGLEAFDPDMATASAGGVVTTPSGMVLDGSKDAIESPPASSASADPDGDGKTNEIDVALVDHMEFYLLHYFKAGLGAEDNNTRHGRRLLEDIGCTRCHIPDLTINSDRRVADVETVYDPVKGIFNRLFATALALFNTVTDSPSHPTLKVPKKGSFVVKNIFTDFKRHDLGANFHERNYDGTIQKEFMTEALWGVGTTAPYGHDGRSINLMEVILRHGGEAQTERDAFDRRSDSQKADIIAFLNTLILFPPDDTASNLDGGDKTHPLFPQKGHGSIKLTVLFNDPGDPE